MEEQTKPRIEMVDPSGNPTVIKVVGVGGGGGNAVNRMVDVGFSNVDFISINTDKQALSLSKADLPIVIGQGITGGLGAGTDPSRGEKAAREDMDTIRQSLEGADMVFIASGFGGGTGTGASPVVAEIAKSLGALTVGVITKPFDMEGSLRKKRAEEGIEKMLDIVDSLIIVPNQNLFSILPEDTPYEEALRVADDVLRSGVQGIADIITMPGMVVNVDFADVKMMLTISRGKAHMGIGIGKGENRIVEAVENALNNPLLDLDGIRGAKGILANIVGPKNLTISEYQKAAKIINEYAHEEANIKIGTCSSEAIEDEIRITVVAAGFENSKREEAEDASSVPNVIKVAQEEEKAEEKNVYSFGRHIGVGVKDEPVKVQESEMKEELVKIKAQVTEEKSSPIETYIKNEETAQSDNSVVSEEVKEKVSFEDTVKESQTSEPFVSESDKENQVPVKTYNLPFDIVSEEEMRTHQKRGTFEQPGVLNDDIETPAFLRKRSMLR